MEQSVDPWIETMPDLLLDQIFDFLSFDEFIKLTKVPTWRNVILNYLSYQVNYTKIKCKIIMECIFDHFENIGQDLFSHNIMDYFIQIGYRPSLKAKKLVKEYIDFLEDDIDVDDIRYTLQQDDFQIPYNWIRLTKNLSAKIRQKAIQLENQLEELDIESKTLFLMDLERSSDHVGQLLDQVRLYNQKFVQDEDANQFIKCINRKFEYLDFIIENT